MDDAITFIRDRWPSVGFTIKEGEIDDHDAEMGAEYNGTTAALGFAEHGCQSPWTEVLLVLN